MGAAVLFGLYTHLLCNLLPVKKYIGIESNIEIYILPAGIVQLNTICFKVYFLAASQDVTFGDEDVVFYGLLSQVLITS